MIIDFLSEFMNAEAITAAVGSNVEGSLMDLGKGVVRDAGSGQTKYLVIQITTAVTSAGAATLSFSLASDAQDPIAPATATVHATTPVVAKALLVVGYKFPPIAIPKGVNYERYLGLFATVGTANLTAGAADAFIVEDISNWTAYPDGAN